MFRCLVRGLQFRGQAACAALVVICAFPASAGDVRGIIKGEWTPEMSPITVMGDAVVPPGETLTIAPGVSVQLVPGVSLRVEGTLLALATPIRPIRFQPATPMSPWRALEVVESGHAVLNACAILGGGSANPFENSGMLRVLGGSLALQGCRVSGSVSSGIYVRGGTLVSKASSYLHNGGSLPTDAAIHVVEGAVELGLGTQRNSIVNDTFYAIYNENLSPIQAPDTWWGSATGPQHPDNIPGLGSSVSDDVVFSGFSTTPPARRKGDVNGDGLVDGNDVALAAEASGGTVLLDPDAFSAADVYPSDAPDGQIDLLDVMTLSHASQGRIAL